MELITKTFAALRTDPRIGRAEALRRSMVALISKGDGYAHPATWAPFVLVGEGQASIEAPTAKPAPTKPKTLQPATKSPVAARLENRGFWTLRRPQVVKLPRRKRCQARAGAMRLAIPCMKCFQERGEPDDALYPAELQESGAYATNCRFNHSTITVLQELKFELLSELAANAIVDGYYREAVASFASSVERFHEFYIRVVASKNGIVDAQFAEAWKRVSSQSERQLGAYVMVYTMETGQPPPRLTQSKVEFRNDVIHKGVIPSNEKAVEFGDAAIAVIYPVLHQLKTSYSEHVRRVVGQHIADVNRNIHSGVPRATMTIPTIVSLARSEGDSQPRLHTWVESLRRRRAASGW